MRASAKLLRICGTRRDYLDHAHGELQDNYHVAIGTGRGAALTVKLFAYKALPNPSARRITHLTVSPLTGYLSASLWATQAGEYDSGTAALELSKGCWHCTIETLPLPVALDQDTLNDQRIQDFLLKQSPLALETWNKNTPQLAIVGVGVLAEGHRMLYRDPCPPELKPIEHLLDDLNKTLEEYGSVQVGDLCNRLYGDN